jgi:alpha-1,2-mannosyltransferase
MVVILWLGVIVHSLMLLHQLHSRVNQFDFSIYYASGLALREHIDPYTTDLDRVGRGLQLEIDPIHFATDPPTFLLCMEPLTLLPVRQAFWLWTALNFAALVSSLILLLRGSGVDFCTALALIALGLLYPPVGEHFFYGQNKIFVLLALVLVMRWMAHGHDAAAGLILGIAALMRGFPLLMIGYLVLRRRWRVIAYTVAGMAIGGLLTVAILGLQQTLSFSNGLRFVTKPRFLALPINVSLGAFVSRLYWYAFGAHGGFSNAVRLILVAAAEIGLLAVTVKATLKYRDAIDMDWRAFSLWVVTAVMLSPTAWVHYLVLMLIPFAQMAIAADRGRANHRAIWMAVASFLLISLSTSGRTAFGPHPRGGLPIMIAECSFGSLMMAYLSAYWFASDDLMNAVDCGAQ